MDPPAARQLLFVLPLRAGSEKHIRHQLDAGLDLEDVSGLERCEIFVTAEELILLCEAEDASSLVARVESWQEYLAGEPRLAESVYSWARPEEDDELSFLPTPGPGDSDGGDIF